MSAQYKIDDLLRELESSGKRSTPQRHAVCQALVEHGGHPTVSEVYERVRDIFPMISQATVYNTIDTLEELGLIHRLDIANHEHTHYDLDQHAHVNLVCTQCGHITDLHLDALDRLLEQVSQDTSYEITRSTGLVVYGACPQCRREASNQPHAAQPGRLPIAASEATHEKRPRQQRQRRGERRQHRHHSQHKP
jgi:Fur family peroxide stress response transcriptional regulator